MNKHVTFGLVFVVWLSSACREPKISDGPWLSEISRHGDTTVVRTVSGSVWEEPARLVEDLRVGQLEGEGETTFGAIAYAAVAEDGTILLFDSHVPSISRFDASGEFLGTVGREGEGPGEYSAHPTGMIVHGSRLLLADPRNLRLSAFSLDGEYQGSLGPVTGLSSLYERTLAAGEAGGVVVRILTVRHVPGQGIPEPWPIGLEVRGPDGTVQDTISPQMFLGQQARLAEWLPGGGVLVDSRSEFVFELRHDRREIIRVVMPFEPVEYSEGELRMLGRALAPAAAADGKREAPIPELKSTYMEFLFSPDGRVWARRPISDSGEEATWRLPLHQPSALDVFDPGGSYLGLVPLPAASRPVVATDTHLYVIELGEFDEPYFVRYRVEIP